MVPGKQHRYRRPAPVRDLPARVGALVRAQRTAARLSQADLGAPYYTRAMVSAVELGKIAPSLKTLARFADKLDVPPARIDS